jgi:DNA-binding transcriptional MerR regulator
MKTLTDKPEPDSSARNPELSDTFTIKKLVKEFGITARTLRFYEEERLLAPLRRGQTRYYSERDRERLLLIMRGRRVGFSVAELREMLDLYDGPGDSIAQMIQARRRFSERIATLQQQRIDIEQSLNDLRVSIESIDAVLNKK